MSDKIAEIERLRAEIARLRARVAALESALKCAEIENEDRP